MERFWSKTQYESHPDFSTPCRIWQAAVNPKGYGLFRVGSKVSLAYKWAWEQSNGSVPDGYQLHHQCERKSCVEPTHLTLRTPKSHAAEHVQWNSLKTHCPNGHEYTEENTRYATDHRTTRRQCRACHRQRRMARYYSNNTKVVRT